MPTLEAAQKMIDFNHDKDIGILKLGGRLPNLANSCAQKSTDANFPPFTEADKDMLEKNRENVVGDLFLVFTSKAVADEIFILKSTNM